MSENPASRIALWANRLRDIAAMGGHFARNEYDRDNYRTIQTIAMEMMGLATDTAVKRSSLISSIKQGVRSQLRNFIVHR